MAVIWLRSHGKWITGEYRIDEGWYAGACELMNGFIDVAKGQVLCLEDV